MTRGLRSRPLIEPEPDPPTPVVQPAYVYQGPSDVSISQWKDEQGKFLPGHPSFSPGRPKSVSVTEVLRSKIDPHRLADTLIAMALGTGGRSPDREALTYIYDRLDGRPKQALDVSTPEDDPMVTAARRQALAFENMLRLARGEEPLPTLIEAPISQPGGETK